MRHRHTTPKLGRTPAHRKAMMRNMVTDFFKHEKIQTTQAKAKALRPYAEKLITLGKKGTLTSRRQAARFVRDKAVLKKLFDEIAPRYSERPGGYTRIIKLGGSRAGDHALMAIIEMVEADMPERKKRKKPKYKGPLAVAGDATATADVVEEVVEETEVAEAAADEAGGEVEAAPEDTSAESSEEVDAAAEEATEESTEEPAEEVAEEAPEADASDEDEEKTE